MTCERLRLSMSAEVIACGELLVVVLVVADVGVARAARRRFEAFIVLVWWNECVLPRCFYVVSFLRALVALGVLVGVVGKEVVDKKMDELKN